MAEIQAIVEKMVPYLNDLEMVLASSGATKFEITTTGGQFVWDSGTFPVNRNQLKMIEVIRAILDRQYTDEQVMLHGEVWSQNKMIATSLAQLFLGAMHNNERELVAQLEDLLTRLKNTRWEQ